MGGRRRRLNRRRWRVRPRTVPAGKAGDPECPDLKHYRDRDDPSQQRRGVDRDTAGDWPRASRWRGQRHISGRFEPGSEREIASERGAIRCRARAAGTSPVPGAPADDGRRALAKCAADRIEIEMFCEELPSYFAPVRLARARPHDGLPGMMTEPTVRHLLNLPH